MRAKRGRSRFRGNPSRGAFGGGRVRQLPAEMLLGPQTLAGDSVVDDLHIHQLTVTQKDTPAGDHAATFISAGASYNGNLSRWVNSSLATVTSVDNNAHLIVHEYMGFEETTLPTTPGANQLDLYVRDKAGVSNLYFLDDAGVEHDLGAGDTIASPFVGSQAPGSFTVATAKFGLHGKQLALTGTQRGTIQGTGRLILCG